jgi:hypothetical protein
MRRDVQAGRLPPDPCSFHTLQDLQGWNVSLVPQTGLQFDLRSAQGELIAIPDGGVGRV